MDAPAFTVWAKPRPGDLAERRGAYPDYAAAAEAALQLLRQGHTEAAVRDPAGWPVLLVWAELNKGR